jgi:hypothetical protein
MSGPHRAALAPLFQLRYPPLATFRNAGGCCLCR